MAGKKPKNTIEYIKWLEKEFKLSITNRTRVHYKSVTNIMKRDFKHSAFWNQLIENLKEYNAQYKLKTNYNLMTDFFPSIVIKPFNSFLHKTYRKNIVENSSWPNEPKDGWILPDCWYSRINDIIRSLIVVKYLDGVQFLVEKIKNMCDEEESYCKIFFEAREEGYYAAHLYTKQEFEIPKVSWDTDTIEASVEIQITTQLQEVIRNMLHKYYDEKRKRAEKKTVKWQWDYKSEEFSANYLGHILHYVEGMILDIRDKQKEAS